MLRHFILQAALLTLLSTAAIVSADTSISYKLAKDGKVSLAINNQSGQLVRRLHVGDDMKSGHHLAHWDGLDEAGRPLPPGEYEWRLVNSQGIRSQFLTCLGTSDGYWHWPGAHEGPGSVEVVGDTVIMAAHLVEGSPQYVAWDLKTGKVKWYQKPASGFAWVNDLAVGGDTLFVNGFSIGSRQPELLLMDTKTGRFVNSWSTWKRALYSFLPIADFTAGTKETSVHRKLEPSVYNETQGHGWIDTKGLEILKVDDTQAIGSTQNPSASFRIDLPKHNNYRTEVVVGNPTSKPRKIKVKISGGGGEHTLVLKPGESKKIENRRNNEQLNIAIRNPKNEPVGWALLGIHVKTSLKRIAAHGDTLVALLPGNSVVWIDPMKGKELFKRPFTVHHQTHINKKVKLHLKEPCKDIEVLPTGQVILLTEEKVLEVKENAQTRTLIAGLNHAARLAADGKTGDLFIVEHGDSQQVKVFDPNFKQKNVFGRKGGRRQGRYEPEDFFEVEDIAGDGHGGFVIVEQEAAPRRTAHFSSKGKLIREWCGAQTFFVHSWHDPKQPTHVWFDNGHGWVTECEVDYGKGTWKPYATYKIAGAGGKELKIQVQHTGYLGFHIRYHQGKKYLCKVRDPVILRIEEEQRRVVPVAKYYSFAFNQYTLTKERIPTWALSYEQARKNKYIGLMWSDLNGDGKAQRNEARLSKQNYSAGDSWIGDDLTYYTSNGYVAKPKWKNGVPIYPLPSEAKKQPAEANWRDSDGNFYRQYCGGHLNIHGFGWPSTMVAENGGLRKFSADGKTLLYDVGCKAVTWPGTHREGQLHFPVKIAGVVKGTVGVAQRVGAPVEFWTTDGLYIGHIFNRQGEGPEIAYHWWRVDPAKGDSFGRKGNQALFQYDTAAGGRLVVYKDQVYFFGAGWNNVPTYRLSGFDELQRQKGKLILARKATLAEGTGKGLTARYYLGNKTGGQPVVERIENQIHIGKFGNYQKKLKKKVDWPKQMTEDPKATFTVHLAGFIEPKLTDTYRFFIYGGPANVYIDNKQVLDSSWKTPRSGARYPSRLIRLDAGKKVAIRIDAQRQANQPLYLSWEGEAFSAEVVPGNYLYSDKK